MKSYQLFSKPIKLLDFEDLNKLREIPEGWFIDYKQAGMDIKKIAKHLSSFANTYGGWLFFGVKESNDKKRVADSFPGIKSSKIPLLEDHIRDAAIFHISPTPYYEHKVIEGPSEILGLEEGRAIIAVYIPEGTTAPYIHSSGMIFSRTGDASEPIPLKRHNDLEPLWERRRGTNDRLKRVFNDLPQRLESEKNQTFVHLFFILDPTGTRDTLSDIEFEHFSRIMKDISSPRVGLCLENAFVSNNAYIARDTRYNDRSRLLFQWYYYLDGSSRVSIPINSYSFDTIYLSQTLSKYDHITDFVEVLQKNDIESGCLLDLNILMVILMGCLEKQRELMKADGFEIPVYAKIHVEGIWRCIPYIDTLKYIEFLGDFGIPFIQEDNQLVPPGTSFDSLLYLYGFDPSEPEISPDFDDANELNTFELFSHVCTAFGIPLKQVISPELFKVSERAKNIKEIE